MFAQKPVRNEIINALQTSSVGSSFADEEEPRLLFRIFAAHYVSVYYVHAAVTVNQYYVFID